MIIRAIRAENFMKFATLELSGLPARGLIGIEGPNESGKTTIGEAVLFAFFGKTRNSLETSVSRLIRWGSDYLSVEVEFSVPGRGDFLIYREIDKYGTNFVKVVEVATRSEVATGNVNVSEFLARALKFDFIEFHQSFYHDQRPAGLSQESQSSFVERMTGIAQIGESAQSLKKEIEQLEREFAHYQKDIQRNLQQMEKYERNAAKLPELRGIAQERRKDLERAEAEHRRRQEECDAIRKLGEERQSVARRLEGLSEEPAETVLSSLGEIRGRLERLAQGSEAEREFAAKQGDDLQSQAGRISRIEGMLKAFLDLRSSWGELNVELERRLDPKEATSFIAEEKRLREEILRVSSGVRRRSVGALVFLALAVLAAALGGALLLDPAGEFLPRQLQELHRQRTIAGSAGALVLFLVLALFFLAARLRAGRRRKQLQLLANEQAIRIQEDLGERERLAGILAISGPGEVVRLAKASEGLIDPYRAERRLQFLREYSELTDFDGEGDYRKVLQSLARMEREFRSRANREAQRADRTCQEAEGALRKARADLEKVENEIRECEGQAAKREVLAGKNKELEARSDEIRREIDLRRMSIELLDDTAATIRNKVGPSLSRFLREVLPRLTSGRYKDIKVSNDLGLQIFTSEKGDFLDRSELSGGAQEALSLALRLATSQAFIDSRTRQAQFMFLDEPFRMMDETRALDCLRALPALSRDLQQFFVIQPVFTPAQRDAFDCRVQTRLDLKDLTVNFASADAAGAGASRP